MSQRQSVEPERVQLQVGTMVYKTFCQWVRGYGTDWRSQTWKVIPRKGIWLQVVAVRDRRNLSRSNDVVTVCRDKHGHFEPCEAAPDFGDGTYGWHQSVIDRLPINCHTCATSVFRQDEDDNKRDYTLLLPGGPGVPKQIPSPWFKNVCVVRTDKYQLWHLMDGSTACAVQTEKGWHWTHFDPHNRDVHDSPSPEWNSGNYALTLMAEAGFTPDAVRAPY